MKAELIQTRISTCTSSLPQAVQGSQSGQFAMLLSLISTYQADMPVYAAADPLPVQQLPESEVLHTPYLVGRLNSAVSGGNTADFAYINSYISTLAEQGVPVSRSADKAAVFAAGEAMLGEIGQSQQLATA